MGRKTVMVMGGVVLAFVLMIGYLAVNSRKDTTAPEIKFPEAEAEYEADADVSVFLEGVTAYDAEDGDVTSSLLIESVVYCDNDTRAKVSYAVCDSGNNVAKAYRTVKLKSKEETEPEGTEDRTAIVFPDEQ